MIFLLTGAIAFICFFVYDFNNIIWQNTMLHHTFTLGIVLILTSTALAIVEESSLIQWDRGISIVGIIFAVGFFIALIYTLFFALPFKTTYVTFQKTSNLCTDGVYALCRHPGFWCLAGFYLSLYIVIPSKTVWMMTLLFNGLNFLYIVFQDQWSFRKTFVDYGQYADSTPFLVPNFSSIKKCINTLENKKGACNEFKK